MFELTLLFKNRLAENQNNNGNTGMPMNSGTVPEKSLETTGVEAVNSTTKFDDDAVAVTGEQIHPRVISNQYLSQDENFVAKTIEGFLSKPKILERGVFQPTDVVGTFTAYHMPKIHIQSPIYKDKLRGYFGFRATTVLTLQVNATRFQQGRYMLTWVPVGGARYNAGLPGEAWVDMHSATLTQRTQLPRVEIDLNCDTSAELRIPFSSALDFYPLAALADTNNYGTWGVARIFPYSALNAVTGATTCNYTVWSHFEDVELIGPAVPQDIEDQAPDITFKKKRKNKEPSAVEQDSVGVGPISSVAFKVAKAASYFNPVPVLGQYTTALSWVTEIVGNAASVFGWSAPVNLKPTERMVRANAPYASNINKVDNSFPLSLDVTNMVDVMPGFGGTDIDELDIAYLAQIPFLNYTTTWTTSQVANDQIISYNVSPGDNIKTQLYGVFTASHYGPCQYFSTLFKFWRGSMRYRIKFVKTEYHSGRLAISFTPVESRSVQQLITDAASTDYVLRDVVDIRETNEYEFTVPFISSTPYKLLQGTTTVLGQIDIRVIDALVAPDTVPQTVTMLIEMSAGPDIEFAGFNSIERTVVDPIVYQANDISDCSLYSGMLGNATTPKFQVETSKAAIGERVLSLRALVKRFQSVSKRLDNQVEARYINVLPFSFEMTDWNLGTIWTPRTSNDLYGELASMFTYSRGGTRLKLVPDTLTNPATVGYMFNVTSDSDTANNIVTQENLDGSGVDYRIDTIMHKNTYVMTPDTENVIEVQTPQYTVTHSRCNADVMVSPTQQYLYAIGSLAPMHGVSFTLNFNDPSERPNITGRVLRAGADDCNFSSFVSIPPML